MSSWSFSLTITRWPTHRYRDGDAPRNYTTPRDATVGASTVDDVLLSAAAVVWLVLTVAGVMLLLDLVRGRTRWQVRRRLLDAARARVLERTGRTAAELSRDRAAALGCSTGQVERMPPEVLGAQLRQLMVSRGASPLQAYYLRSPATEDFLAGRAPLPPVEELAREALLEHLVSDGIALPHDAEYLAAKAGMPLQEWLALPHPTQLQVVSRLFDLTTELPHVVEDIDRQWQSVFLRRGLALQEWRSIPVRERYRQAEAYLNTHPDLIPSEIARRSQALDLLREPAS